MVILYLGHKVCDDLIDHRHKSFFVRFSNTQASNHLGPCGSNVVIRTELEGFKVFMILQVRQRPDIQ